MKKITLKLALFFTGFFLNLLIVFSVAVGLYTFDLYRYSLDRLGDNLRHSSELLNNAFNEIFTVNSKLAKTIELQSYNKKNIEKEVEYSYLFFGAPSSYLSTITVASTNDDFFTCYPNKNSGSNKADISLCNALHVEYNAKAKQREAFAKELLKHKYIEDYYVAFASMNDNYLITLTKKIITKDMRELYLVFTVDTKALIWSNTITISDKDKVILAYKDAILGYQKGGNAFVSGPKEELFADFDEKTPNEEEAIIDGEAYFQYTTTVDDYGLILSTFTAKSEVYYFITPFFILQIVVIFALVLLTLFFALILVNKIAIKPVKLLTRAVNDLNFSEIDRIGNIDVDLARKDEYKVLENSIKSMLERINQTHILYRKEKDERSKLEFESSLIKQIYSYVFISSSITDTEDVAKIKSQSLFNNSLELSSYIKFHSGGIGGDFYDFTKLDDHKLLFYIGDVAGKGLASSIITVEFQSILKGYIQANQGRVNLEKLLNSINTVLATNNPQSIFITLFIGIIDLKQNQIHYINAGHNPPIFNKNLLCSPPSVPLACFDDTKYHAHAISFKPGDFSLLLYTDGLTEANNADNGQMFGEQRVRDFLLANDQSIGEEKIKQLVSEVEKWTNNKNSDDLTLLLLESNRQFLIDKPQAISHDKILLEKFFKRNDLSGALEFIDKILLHYPQKLVAGKIITEEIVLNIQNYSGASQFAIKAKGGKEMITLTFLDDGKAFNPLKIAPKVRQDDLLKQSAGGFGIEIVRNLSQAVNYERKSGHNILRVKL